MASIILVQAVIVATSGRMYKTQPKELREGLELDDYKSSLRSDLRMGQYPIDFINEHGHDQVIMPANVETIVFNVLGQRPEHVAQEPAYDQLQAKWRQDLRRPEPVASEADTAIIPVVPDGAAASTMPLFGADGMHTFKFQEQKPPEQKVYVMHSEVTQEVPIQKILDEEAAENAVKRVAESATKPEQPRAGVTRGRRRPNRASSGKVTQD